MARLFASLSGAWRLLPVGAALALLLAGGVVHGLWSNRWGGDADLEEAAARLAGVPRVVGDWEGTEHALDAERLTRAEAAGHLFRLYRDGDGGAVSVLLLSGRFGPLSVHTPDLCYGGAGYEMVGAAVRHELRLDDGRTAEVWAARFHKPQSPADPPLRVLWSWSAGEGWRAPKWPRWEFRMKPVLFKLYVAREMERLNEPLAGDPGLAFLRAWLPKADGVLFGGEGGRPGAAGPHQ